MNSGVNAVLNKLSRPSQLAAMVILFYKLLKLVTKVRIVGNLYPYLSMGSLLAHQISCPVTFFFAVYLLIFINNHTVDYLDFL